MDTRAGEIKRAACAGDIQWYTIPISADTFQLSFTFISINNIWIIYGCDAPSAIGKPDGKPYWRCS